MRRGLLVFCTGAVGKFSPARSNKLLKGVTVAWKSSMRLNYEVLGVPSHTLINSYFRVLLCFVSAVRSRLGRLKLKDRLWER